MLSDGEMGNTSLDTGSSGCQDLLELGAKIMQRRQST